MRTSGSRKSTPLSAGLILGGGHAALGVAGRFLLLRPVMRAALEILLPGRQFVDQSRGSVILREILGRQKEIRRQGFQPGLSTR